MVWIGGLRNWPPGLTRRDSKYRAEGVEVGLTGVHCKWQMVMDRGHTFLEVRGVCYKAR